jgi:2-phospho-L-lactate transferase/gluconeogenesis factor (CofD/UPF0052 family)
MAKVIKESKAKKVYIANIMTRFGQTDGFGLKEHIGEFDKYLGKNVLDYCLYNNPKNISKKAIEWYKNNDAEVVKNNYTGNVKVITKDLSSSKFYKKGETDKLVRSLIRHDSMKLAKAVSEILFN